LIFNEEYAIESLWHEIMHNRARFPAPTNEFQRNVHELLNQFLARHTYKSFLQSLGGVSKHFDEILKNGYGYQEWIRNLRYALERLELKENIYELFEIHTSLLPGEKVEKILEFFATSRFVSDVDEAKRILQRIVRRTEEEFREYLDLFIELKTSR